MLEILIAFMVTLTFSGCQQEPGIITGAQGPAGPKGDPGTPGSSCSVSQAANGAVISCQDGSSVLLLNGVDGQQTPYTIIEVVDLCNNHKEVLLRFGTNQLIGHYAGGGNNQHLRMLTPGRWMSTDGSNCLFTVTQDMNVTY